MAGNPCLPRIDLTNRGLMPPCSFLILGDEQSTPPAGPDLLEPTGFRGMTDVEFGGDVSCLGQPVPPGPPGAFHCLVRRQRELHLVPYSDLCWRIGPVRDGHWG